MPLSWLDRVSLSDQKEATAQRFFEVTKELARRCQGENFEYHSDPGLTNLDEVAQLWWLQARHGDMAATAASVPATALTGAAGVLGGTPIEGAEIRHGQLEKAVATGHGFNPVPNGLSAVSLALGVSGRAGMFSPLLLALGAVGPLLTAVPVAMQAAGDGNAPVHEMAHAMQFLLLGDLVRKGVLDSSDLVAIQNHQGPTGYLWGGDTEAAAHHAEVTGKADDLFEVLRKRCLHRLDSRYGAEAGAKKQVAAKILGEHQEWIEKQLKGS